LLLKRLLRNQSYN